jgi:general secretion pathway protein N
LTGWGAPWNTIQPDGELRIQTRQWRWQQDGARWHNDGQITLQLLGLSTRLSSLRPLGDYKLMWMGGDTPQISLETLQGPLQMSGQGQWRDGRVVFEGEAWAEHPDDEIALTNLLSVLGNRKGARAVLKMG